jgi:hypothetical protein
VDEVVVLRNNMGAGSREIERVGLFSAAEVVQFEDEVAREVFLVTPDYPADPSVYQAEFVPGGVDGFNAGKTEVPVVDS